MEQVHCDLCGANQPIPYLKSRDRFSGIVFTLSMCGNCGLIYLTPRPTYEELSKQYPDNYEAYHLQKIDDTSKKSLQYPRFLISLLDYVERYYPSRGKLLDIGCATGEFMNYARSKGWQVSGIEVIEKAAKKARDYFDLDVLNTDLESTILQPSSLNVVTMWDVLEHLPSPRQAMEKIHEVLKPSGMVYFSIPNLDSIDRKLFGNEWIGWDPPRHFTLFTERTIQRLLSETGFSLINKKCLTGGKGTFKLSLDRILDRNPRYRWIKRLYPVIDISLWPYRQISYISHKGPIMFYAAQKN